MPETKSATVKTSLSRLDMLERLWNNSKKGISEHPLLVSVMRTTHNVLDAAASAVIVYEEEKPRIIFKKADGPVESQVQRLYTDTRSGIAGWVVTNGKPMVVNDVGANQLFDATVDNPAGFRTRSLICAPLVTNNRVIGVIEGLNKQGEGGFTDRDLRTILGLANTATLALENIHQNDDLQSSYKSTLRALVSLADAKETYASGHSRRVAEYALIGAAEMGLSWVKRQTIEYAAILHDIGKLGIPDYLLNKTGQLSKEEWEIIRRHPATGYELLKEIPFLKEASQLILYHHERYDGKGYPTGTKGNAIPIGARLICVADSFDAMTAQHPYKPAISARQALNEISRCIGTQFCPEASKAFIQRYAKMYLANGNGQAAAKPAAKPAA
jgi:putative nucleotidyltransferase with HDIG domain